jgi:hypothetical protein
VWILRIEAARLAKEKVTKTGIRGCEQMEFEEGVHMNGETRESEEHQQEQKKNKF